MTSAPLATSEMDQLDQLGAKAYDGFLVRKDLVRKYSRQYPVPTYVVEFLLGRYCASTDPAEIEEGLQIVEKQLQGRSRDQGSVKIIDIVRARLDTRSDSYMAEVPSLAIKDAQIDDELVRANERMLTDGFYAEVSLEHDPVIAQERNGRPFRIAGLRPIQMSNPNVLGILAKGRAAFTTEEWRDFLIRSIGLEPTALDERAKRVMLLRMAPFVERNFNLVELGPRGTGKSHLFQQISPTPT
jgi:ATP-dependent Lon protease